MKKTLVIMTVIGVVGAASAGSINWGSSTGPFDPATFLDEAGVGLAVGDVAQLYQVVGAADTVSGSTIDIAALNVDDALVAASTIGLGTNPTLGTREGKFWVLDTPWATAQGQSYYIRVFNDAAGAVVGNYVGDSGLFTIDSTSEEIIKDMKVIGTMGTDTEIIPEPATIGLMGLAGLGMFLARRKARR